MDSIRCKHAYKHSTQHMYIEVEKLYLCRESSRICIVREMITSKVTLYTPVMLIIERRKNIHIFLLVFLLETTTKNLCVYFVFSVHWAAWNLLPCQTYYFLFILSCCFFSRDFRPLFVLSLVHSFSLSSWLILIDWQGLMRSVLPLRSREFSPVTEDFDLDGGHNWSWHVVGGKEKDDRQKRKKRSTNF